MSINFLVQAIRVLHIGSYTESELIMLYNFLSTIDNSCLNSYYNTCSILSYKNDLQLYLEIIDGLVKIFEEREEYEKCFILMNKKQRSLDIIKEKIN